MDLSAPNGYQQRASPNPHQIPNAQSPNSMVSKAMSKQQSPPAGAGRPNLRVVIPNSRGELVADEVRLHMDYVGISLCLSRCVIAW